MPTATDTAPPPAATPVPKGVPPPGWGNDELTKFLQHTHENQHATFFHKHQPTAKLIAIDAEFVKVSKGWLNPSSEVVAMLFLRSHAAFRTACGLAMSGQAVEAFVQCRAMLENAAYAAHIHCKPVLAKVWLDRHQSDADMKASRKAFRHEEIVASLTAANAHAGRRFEDMYQKMIDLGGHPNERSVTGNMQMIEEPDRRVMLATMLHGDGIYLDHALKTVAQCGMISLEMLEIVYEAKFTLLGIKAAMLKLRKDM
jgi:hypothetical protein